MGYQGLMTRLHRAQTWEVVILTEKDFLFPENFKTSLESKLPIHFKVEVAQDPDSFLEKAASADLLWARKDWIIKTEFHLTDFKSQKNMAELLSRSLSADFFDPEETSATLLPLLWTLPLVRLKISKAPRNLHDLFQLPGRIQWPFWGLEDFFPDLPKDFVTSSASKEQWMLFPYSIQNPETEKYGLLWFPEKKIRPFVIYLAFVENEKLPLSLKQQLLTSFIETRSLAHLAFETKMALTLVQAEELLPPWQRASALRKIDLSHLGRP